MKWGRRGASQRIIDVIIIITCCPSGDISNGCIETIGVWQLAISLQGCNLALSRYCREGGSREEQIPSSAKISLIRDNEYTQSIAYCKGTICEVEDHTWRQVGKIAIQPAHHCLALIARAMLEIPTPRLLQWESTICPLRILRDTNHLYDSDYSPAIDCAVRNVGEHTNRYFGR